MKNNYKYYSENKKWFSIIFAMWIVLISTLMAFTILEYIEPFSRNIKWIENSSRSYYEANAWVEEAMWHINQNRVGYETWTIMSNTNIWREFDVVAMWKNLPFSWLWNSWYDSNWNKIFLWGPIQLQLWWDVATLVDTDWVNIKFTFKVPNLNWESWLTLSWGILPIINWQLSSQSDTLNSSWSYIIASNINNKDIIFNNKEWKILDGTWQKFSEFFKGNCEEWEWLWTWSWCVLKLSIINQLELDDNNWTIVPYLEWKIDSTGSSKNIPLRYGIIKASGKSYGFKKKLEVRVPQQSISEAFDFTVFQ